MNHRQVTALKNYVRVLDQAQLENGKIEHLEGYAAKFLTVRDKALALGVIDEDGQLTDQAKRLSIKLDTISMTFSKAAN